MANQLKYQFHYFLNKMPHSEYKRAMKLIPKELNISFETWKKWIYIKIDEKREIRSDCALKLCRIFDCNLDELYTNPPSEIIFYELNTVI